MLLTGKEQYSLPVIHKLHTFSSMFGDNGDCKGSAKSENDHKSPSEAKKWLFADIPNNKWEDAGEGLTVTCSSSGYHL